MGITRTRRADSASPTKAAYVTLSKRLSTGPEEDREAEEVAPFVRRMSAQALGLEQDAMCAKSDRTPKSSQVACQVCKHEFRVWGKHHCGLCGGVVCSSCSDTKLRFRKKNVRTCGSCMKKLKERSLSEEVDEVEEEEVVDQEEPGVSAEMVQTPSKEWVLPYVLVGFVLTAAGMLHFVAVAVA